MKNKCKWSKICNNSTNLIFDTRYICKDCINDLIDDYKTRIQESEKEIEYALQDIANDNKAINELKKLINNNENT